MTNARTLVKGTLLAAIAAMTMAAPLMADTDNSNNSAYLTITVSPNVDIGVIMDTQSVTLDSFSLAPGATDFSLAPGTATIAGNIQPQELDVLGTKLDTWTLDTDEAAGANSLQLYSLFSVGRTTHPIESEFAGTTNLVIGAGARAGGTGGAGVNYENAVMSGNVDMDNLNIGDARQIWFRMDAPPLTSTADPQKFKVTLTATTTNL